MPTPDSVSGKNAFAVLMTTSQQTNNSATKSVLRRTSSVGTEFVVCPAGCGKRMLEKDINLHLDQCIQRLQQDDIDSSQEQQQSIPPTITGDISSCSQPITQPSSVMQYAVSHRLSSKKRRRVICPSCQNSFPSALINLHLDQCITRTSSKPKRTTQSSQLTVQSIENESSSTLEASEQAVLLSETKVHAIVKVDDDDHANNYNGSPIADTCRVDYNESESLDSIANESNHESQNDHSIDTTTLKRTSQSGDSNSAFTTMMKQAKALFSKKDKGKPPLHLSFHMDESLRVRLSYPMTIETEWTPPVWSILMNVRDKYSNIPDLDNPTQASSIQIEVTLSTDIPTYINPPIRWVRQHSQLSVPVLKSILQKSIRRRKPLPAVRVAMELADKALGELLRRLPVIMLEDSYLHPDINLLIWIMMAYTKDYQPSSNVMIRIFQIIYEIAACQWSDLLSMDDAATRSSDEHFTPTVTLTSLFKREKSDNINPTPLQFNDLALPSSSSSSSSFDDKTTYIWSMLVRAEYGGLKCDIQMFHRYATLWFDRFSTGSNDNVPDFIIRQLIVPTKRDPDIETSNESIQLQWSTVPTLIHQKVREQGLDRVAALCNHGIERLVVDDVCVEGIDYHCSGIVNALSTDETISGICFDLMTLAEQSSHQNGTPPPMLDSTSTQNELRRTDLENILKNVIWHFSSNVNHRRPLLLGNPSSSNPYSTTTGPDRQVQYTELWNDLIAQRALQYQKNYVHQRLTR